MDGFGLRNPNLTTAEFLTMDLAKVSLKGMSAGFDQEFVHIEEKLAIAG